MSANKIYYSQTVTVSDKIMREFESYLDDAVNHEYIPHKIHEDLLQIFENLNNDVEVLIEGYEDRIKELENKLNNKED